MSDLDDCQPRILWPPPTHCPSFTVSSISSFLTSPSLTQACLKVWGSMLSPPVLDLFLSSRSQGFKYHFATNCHIDICSLAPDLPPYSYSQGLGHLSNRHELDETKTETLSLSPDLLFPHFPQLSKWQLLLSYCLGYTL